MKIEHLTVDTFREKITDDRSDSNMKFIGKNPAIIEFYANWCPPCKVMEPILEELAEKYKEKIDIYKVNVDEQQELALAFMIMNIPTLILLSDKTEIQNVIGGQSKESLELYIQRLIGD